MFNKFQFFIWGAFGLYFIFNDNAIDADRITFWIGLLCINIASLWGQLKE